MNTIKKFITVLSALLFLAATMLSPTNSMASKSKDDPDYTIGVGDVLSILVWDQASLNQEITVLPDGNISFPLIGNIRAAGNTSKSLAQKIANRLNVIFRKRPSVTVIVRSIGNDFFYIMGAVGHAGIIPYTHRTRLLQAIILAGGTVYGAKTDSILLIRNNHTQTVSIEDLEKGRHLEKNIEIEPQDVIIVPMSTDQIYIMGESNAPGPYFYTKGLTVLQALLNAHGFSQFASLGSVKIIRQEKDGSKKIIHVDIDHIENEKGTEKKEYLKPGDLIYVPQRMF
ncbi:MAG: polysaccharide biosynthesis/export family protein [Leptospirillum sp.]|jgi:polysaccharide export outer membrane protein